MKGKTLATKIRDTLAEAGKGWFAVVEDGVAIMPADPDGRRGTAIYSGTYGIGIGEAAYRDMLRDVLAKVEAAHVFAFEWEPMEEDEQGRLAQPMPTPDEIGFFEEGLLPLPYPTVIFEYAIGDDRRSILIDQEGEGPGSRITMRCIDRDTANDNINVTPYEVFATFGKPFEIGFVDPHDCVPAHTRWQGSRNGTSGQVLQLTMTANVWGCIYLLTMLGSTSTEVERVSPRPFATRRRRDRGLRPELEHRIVRLIPRRIWEAMSEDGGGAAAHRRIHWRRSHKRKLASGREIVVSRCIVGYRSLSDKEPPPNIYSVRA